MSPSIIQVVPKTEGKKAWVSSDTEKSEPSEQTSFNNVMSPSGEGSRELSALCIEPRESFTGGLMRQLTETPVARLSEVIKVSKRLL